MILVKMHGLDKDQVKDFVDYAWEGIEKLNALRFVEIPHTHTRN